MRKLRQHCDCLFISPHLDDAVLSCALRILQERRVGKTVAVATLCSSGLGIPGLLALYSVRRREDEAALSVLGVDDPIQLGFKDAPFRNLFYTSFQRIILGEHPNDAGYAKELTARVAQLCKELTPETVFLPLAVGTHIDHRHTHRLWCTLSPETKIVFYEDRPYSFLPYNLQLRLTEIGANILKPQLAETLMADRAKALRSFAEGLKTVTMYKNVIKSKRQRFRYLLSAARKLKSPQSAQTLKLQANTVTTNDAGELLKIQTAVSAYKSQMSMLFDNMDTFTKESASYNSTLDTSGLYCERYWHLVR